MYDTLRSEYITRDDVYRMLRKGIAVRVTDRRDTEDQTYQVLLDIVMDRELGRFNQKKHFFTQEFLLDWIRSSEGQYRFLLGGFLEHSMTTLEQACCSEFSAT